MLKKLKIALLIVILAEEIRSAKKPKINVISGIDEREITKIVNKQNEKNSNYVHRNDYHITFRRWFLYGNSIFNVNAYFQ